MSSVRFICGTTDIHKNLEQKIAKFHGREDCILFPSCFDANAAIFETLLTPEDCVISDELNHASIIDGIRLCKAKRLRYKHGDMQDLERCLEEAKDSRIKMIATDGVFSMDGNIAKLPYVEIFPNNCISLEKSWIWPKNTRPSPSSMNAMPLDSLERLDVVQRSTMAWKAKSLS